MGGVLKGWAGREKKQTSKKKNYRKLQLIKTTNGKVKAVSLGTGHSHR